MTSGLRNVDVSGIPIEGILWNSLRRCQQDSLKKTLSYLATSVSSTKHKSCLVSLPTGAGKSGMIAVLSHFCKQKKVLVICHRRAVCDQLANEIDGVFFRKTCPTSQIKNKKVFTSPKNISLDGIYVTTFQMLATLSEIDIKKIKNGIDLIIIDEGHSEPSPVWKTLVRDTKAHKVVVTATPYRNDLFQFDIDPTVSYVYTFSHALKDGVLTEPTFQTSPDAEILPKVLDFLASNSGSKCIIKCKTFEEVELFYKRFDPHVKVLALHDRYTNESRHNVKTAVPKDLAASDYRVLIHQRKLDEGVDIPAAKLLILTYALGSGRELVQTVGRVVRTFGKIQPVVIEIDHPVNFSMWSSYRDFDLSITTTEGAQKFLKSLDSARLIELYLDAFPEYSYHDNRFVGKFDINAFIPDDALNIPTASVCFFETQPGFAVEQAIDNLYWRACNQGELSRIFKSCNTEIIILISIAFKKSRFLLNELFSEPTLEVTLFRAMENSVVAVFDSRGRSYSSDDELKIGRPLDQEKLMKIMTRGSSLQPKEASTRSISSALKRPESMLIKSRNLDDLGSQQQFSAYRVANIKCDTLDGSGKKSGSYYVGVDAGRISDHKDRNLTLHDLNLWLDMVDVCLLSKSETSSRILRSFAKPILPNANLVVEAIVFDLSDLESPVEICANGSQFEIANDFIYIPYANGALLVEGIQDSEIKIDINNEFPHIEFRFSTEVEVLNPSGILSFSEFLAKRTHKVLFGDGITYSAGRFYELRLPTHSGFMISDSEIGGVLVSRAELLADDLTEKGHVNGIIQTNGDEFFNNSVFHLVDKLKNYADSKSTISDLGPFYQYIGSPDYMLCADMGTEPADFLITSPEKLVYVHVKCGASSQRPQSSAGALAEVGSQAIKNLEMLVSGDRNLKAGNWSILLSNWPDASAIQKLTNRIRLFEGRRFDSTTELVEPALEKLWGVLSDRRRSLGVKKEVWIVAANSFSIDDFKKQMLLGSNGRHESLQAFQLLQGWISAASNLDAEIKVFASP